MAAPDEARGLPAFLCLPARYLFAALVLAIALAPSLASAQADCDAPEPVCAARGAVFALSSPFDPLASAVLVAPGELVTNRHVVADETRVVLRLADGRRIEGEVVPGAYRGDLVLVRVPGLSGTPLARAEAGDGPLYAIGADAPGGAIRVYTPGRLLAAPAAGKPRARLHHTAESRPGNSGGALVDAAGRLVAIVTSGGEGRNDAIPASEIAALEAASGREHSVASRELGRAYRRCIEGLDEADATDEIAEPCRATGNRELLDLAAQALGRAGNLAASEALFREALTLDPNSVNSLLGLAVTLHLAERWREEVAVLRNLVEMLPTDFRVLRMSVQAAKHAGETDLAERALALIAKHHPDALPEAREFLAD